MNDWKLISSVIFGSVLLVLVMIFGLSKMGESSAVLSVSNDVLLDGAKLIRENGEAKVTVVNFSDMECPACKSADSRMRELESLVGVRYVFRHFPLNMHKHAQISARAVESARFFGKGFEMIDLLFEKQSEWSGAAKIEDKLVGYAKSLGIDEGAFLEKLNSGEVEAVVRNDQALGNSLRLPGTPSVFVNGEQIGADFVVAKVKELLENQ